MVDRNVIASRVEAVEKHLARLNIQSRKSKEEFLVDLDAQDIVEYNLFQCVNHLIDLIQHIVVDDNLGFPESAYDAAEILHDKGIFSETDRNLSREMIGFRNIVGHDYISLNKEKIYEMLRNGPEDIKRILSVIVTRFL
jgi:uncharacterized protein YutE (UPF0331/DUF86 family)